MPRTPIVVLVTILFITVGLMRPVDAYIDLGTGSYVLQMLVAGLFGVIFSAKALWTKIRSLAAGSNRRGK